MIAAAGGGSAPHSYNYTQREHDDDFDLTVKLASPSMGPKMDRLRRMKYVKREGMPLHETVWMTLDDPTFSRTAYLYANFSITLIVVSTITFCLETDFQCDNVADHIFLTEDNCVDWEVAWTWFEAFAVFCFTAELLARITTCPSKRLFVRGGANWIDFLAILPFYVELATSLEPWWRVDLQQERTIHRIIALNRGDCCGWR